MYKLGLIGTPLTHSFSKKYFDIKFKNEKINHFSYDLYPINNLIEINNLIYTNNLTGLNVTRPFKTEIIRYLDKIDSLSKETQSVNTIYINLKTKKKIGFNTDIQGFNHTLDNINLQKKTHALILGSGSVSQTISYCLRKKNMTHIIISRTPQANMMSYDELPNIIKKCHLIINTTPLGQYPNINVSPHIPYNLISNNHYCIDLTYNPIKTMFLKQCEKNGANIINGEDMLISQAEAAWKIWINCINNNV